MLKGLLIIDTSIMLEYLQVPDKSSNASGITERIDAMLKSNEYILFLPLATIVETGNHISHVKSNNDVRFLIAQAFVSKVKMALEGTKPFKALEWEAKEIGEWIDVFPIEASKKISFGDCSIKAQFKKICKQFSGLPIKIWSKDDDLKNQKHNWNDPNWKDI